MFVVGMVFGLALVATCGTKPDGVMGTIADMTGAIADLLGVDLAGVKDAAAAPPLSGNCDKEWKYTNATGGQAIYFAEFSVAGYDQTSPEHITTWMCAPTTFDAAGAPTANDPFAAWLTGSAVCPSGSVCDPTPPTACVSGFGSFGIAGVIRVYCGSRSVSAGSVKGGTVWSKVYLKVGP